MRVTAPLILLGLAGIIIICCLLANTGLVVKP